MTNKAHVDQIVSYLNTGRGVHSAVNIALSEGGKDSYDDAITRIGAQHNGDFPLEVVQRLERMKALMECITAIQGEADYITKRDGFLDYLSTVLPHMRKQTLTAEYQPV